MRPDVGVSIVRVHDESFILVRFKKLEQIEIWDTCFFPELVQLMMNGAVFITWPEVLEKRKGHDQKPASVGLNDVAQLLEPLLLLFPERVGVTSQKGLAIVGNIRIKPAFESIKKTV